MSRHTDPSSLDKHTRPFAPSAYKTYAFAQRHKSDKNIPVKLAKTATAALPFLYQHQTVQAKSTCRPAVSPTMSYDWLNLTEKSITCSVNGARTARAKWSCLGLTSHRRPILWKNCYKVESCQQQRRFSSCKHLTLVCELFSFSIGKVRASSGTTE